VQGKKKQIFCGDFHEGFKSPPPASGGGYHHDPLRHNQSRRDKEGLVGIISLLSLKTSSPFTYIHLAGHGTAGLGGAWQGKAR